jgi:signal transduction histidine kinase
MPVWSILASYLAISISHALLFQKLQDSNRRLEERIRSRTQSLEIASREAQNAKAELDRHNASLQQRVQERTRELETALNELRVHHTRLEEANRTKDEFLNNINHELKTPLNAIIGYAGLLLKETGESLSEEQHFDLELIESNGKHLQQVLENIFSLKDIQNGTIELERSPTDLNEMIRAAVASVRPRAQEKGIEVSFEALDMPSALVDPTLIRRVLFNLLDNAIKFSRQGQVTVICQVSNQNPEHPQTPCPREEGGAPYAVVEVQDQGKGIRPEDLDRIFQKFQQGEPPSRKSEGGSGVGLAIAKNLIELHEGRIWVTSRPEAGSTFAFCVPLET